MTQKNFKSRTALTAIAAVIALSSTPALAQQASVPDPVIDSTPVTTAADPLAPEPVATTAEPSEPAANAPVKKAATKAAPSTRRSTATARSAPARATETARAAAPAVPSAPAAQASADAAVPAPAEVPAAAAPAAPPAVQAPPVEQPATSQQAINVSEALPMAGAAGIGLLALAGAGMAVRRRKRRREEEEFEERQIALTEAEAEPVVPPELAFVRPATPLHDPVPGKAPVTPLPAGFDMSKFGRHVQAAYRGPTPDNPSLSLKNRLRRASFFDQQERRAATEANAASAVGQQPAWMAHKPNDAEFLFRPSIRKTAPKPEFQK